MDNNNLNTKISLREQDILGEVSNICMGTAASTLFTILNNRKVSITTPNVCILGHEEIETYFANEAVATAIKSVEGVKGTNLLVLKEDDVKIITNLMMMGPGIAEEGPITELHLSAVSEAMNQMMGSSSTALSQMLNTLVDISAPNAIIIKDKKGWMKEIASDIDDAVVISFKMEIENTLDSNIAQIISVDFAKELIANLDQTKL